MKKEEIYEKLNEIFQDIFDDDDIIVNEATNAEDIDDWDSLAQISLVVSIEKEFKIKFKPAEIAEFHNVGDMVALIEERITK